MNAENLDDSLLAEIETHAVLIAQQAGQILREQFRKPLDVQFKDKKNRDPVTVADHLSDEYLKKAINEKFPSHLILSEEGGAQPESDSQFVWVLDPLDGTVNYMNGLPLFCGLRRRAVEKATRGGQHLCAGQSPGYRQAFITPVSAKEPFSIRKR